MRNATRSHTSGCGWNFQTFGSVTAASTTATSHSGLAGDEELERRQGGDVHADGKEEAGPEQPAEDLGVELEMHEEQDDQEELDRHEDDQDGQEGPPQPLGVAGVDLQAGQHEQGGS